MHAVHLAHGIEVDHRPAFDQLDAVVDEFYCVADQGRRRARVAAQSSRQIETEALAALESFLNLCDLAKFAQHAFGPDEREQLFQTAKTFIEEQDAKAAPADEGLPEVEGEMRKLMAPAPNER